MGKITVIGTGFFEEQLTLGAIRAMNAAQNVILHTRRCGAADYLNDNGIKWSSLDRLYDEYEDFDEHAQAAADAVTRAAADGNVAYCVFDIRDMSARILVAAGAEVIPGPGAEGELMALAGGEIRLFSASDWEDMNPDAACCTIVREIDSRELACEVKLRLSQAYPDDAEAFFKKGGAIRRIRLYELDRLEGYDHMCSALVMPECDPARKNACTMADLARLSRGSKLYADGDFDELCAAAAKVAARCAYAEDRGDFSLSDVITAACMDLLDCNG